MVSEVLLGLVVAAGVLGVGALAICGVVSVCVLLTVLVMLPLTAIKDATRGMSVRPLFKWFDFWVGFFWDSKSRKLYFLPLPMVGLVIQFRPKRPAQADEFDLGVLLANPSEMARRAKLAESRIAELGAPKAPPIERARHAIHRVGQPCVFCDEGPKKTDPRPLRKGMES